MINTYCDSINKSPVMKQSVSNSTYATKKAVETRNTSLQTVINSDTFEYRSAEAEITFSPNSIVKREITAIRAASSQSTATTDNQIRNIPTLLAAKMAGIGNPVLIHATGRNASGEQSEHWATVIGKENGRYKIIDPWDGTERWLEDMEIYKNGGSIKDYAILSNKY